jgi:hypothetical protein
MTAVERGGAVLELVGAALAAAHTDGPPGPLGLGPELSFRCADSVVAVRAAPGAPPPAMFDAFSHLPRLAPAAAGGPPPDLVVYARDGTFPGPAGRAGPPAGFQRLRDDALFVAIADGPPRVDALRVRDGVALSWVDDRGHEPAYARFRPFAELFSAWFPRRGMLLLHAAAVGNADGVVLVVGAGGSGKSTTALLCSVAGMGFLADDFCLLAPGPSPVAHSLYRSAKLRGDSAARLQDHTEARGTGDDGERFYLVDDAATITSGPVRAVVAVRPGTDRAPRLQALPPDAVFEYLVPTALKATSGGEAGLRGWLRAMHELAATTPAFLLDLGWDTDRVVELVGGVLAARPARS